MNGAYENALYWIPADGNGPMEKLLITPTPATPCVWTDDNTLIYYQGLPLTTDAWLLQMRPAPNPPLVRPLIQPRAHTPQLSPDGHWIAYTSGESGAYRVYIQPYPGGEGKWQVSTDGGMAARWARNGHELFYRNGDQMRSVAVQTQPTLALGNTTVLFTGAYEGIIRGIQPGIGYDVSADGKRCLMVKSDREQESGARIEVVHNWFPELRARVSSAN